MGLRGLLVIDWLSPFSQYVDLRTRYSELTTLTSQYIKFISETLRRMEEEEVGLGPCGQGGGSPFSWFQMQPIGTCQGPLTYYSSLHAPCAVLLNTPPQHCSLGRPSLWPPP